MLQNAPKEHSAILSTFIKLEFSIKAFVLYVFEWPLKTGFTVFQILPDLCPNCLQSLSASDECS